jgi:hypothetical protein
MKREGTLTHEAPMKFTIEMPVAPRTRAVVAPSRIGKIHIGGFFDPQVKKSLRLVQNQTDESFQALMLRALNDLFRAHNVPVVDEQKGDQPR